MLLAWYMFDETRVGIDDSRIERYGTFGGSLIVMNAMIYAFGGVSLWEEEPDQSITHEIVDYGPYNEVFPSRKYIYAQRILHSINSGAVRPTEEYSPSRSI